MSPLHASSHSRPTLLAARLQRRIARVAPSFPRGLGALSLLAGLACSDDATVLGAPAAPAGSEAPEPEQVLGPVYALENTVFGANDDPLSYVTLVTSLDISELPPGQAREFSGYSFISGLNGKLLVSDGESPTVTSYDIDAALDWQESARVNFASYGVTGGAAGFERHWFLDEDTAYLTVDITGRVVWSPSEMTITEVKDDTTLQLERDGLQLDATFNRQPRRLRGPILKPFYYRDSDWFLFGQTTSIAVYDADTHEELRVIDVPCPSLEVPSQDEAGNTYFSSWTYGPELGLFDLGPDLCVRRIKPDSTLDESWTPDLTTWTGGRPVKVFRYMSDGVAVGTVLHVDEVDIDFSAGYDEAAAAQLDAHWRLWLFDLENETARPIEGVTGISSGFSWVQLDGRTFFFLPDEDWSRTSVFELDTDGNATKRFESVGFINDWIRLR